MKEEEGVVVSEEKDMGVRRCASFALERDGINSFEADGAKYAKL